MVVMNPNNVSSLVYFHDSVSELSVHSIIVRPGYTFRAAISWFVLPVMEHKHKCIMLRHNNVINLPVPASTVIWKNTWSP